MVILMTSQALSMLRLEEAVLTEKRWLSLRMESVR